MVHKLLAVFGSCHALIPMPYTSWDIPIAHLRVQLHVVSLIDASISSEIKNNTGGLTILKCM